MSYADLWFRDLGARCGLFLASFLVALLWTIRRWSKLRRNCQRDYISVFEAECSDLAASHKTHLFDRLREVVSADEELRGSGRIRILEIGVKTGENLSFYPEESHLICVDVNRKLKDYLLRGEHAWRFNHVFIERVIIGDGGCLTRTLRRGSVDAVVTIRALCSVRSQSAVLKEIHRVLVPGGIYLFMEHIADPRRNSWISWLQTLVSRSGIWPSLHGGCRPDSNPITAIEKTGFEKVSWRRVTLHGDVSHPHYLALTRHHVIGMAVR